MRFVRAGRAMGAEKTVAMINRAGELALIGVLALASPAEAQDTTPAAPPQTAAPSPAPQAPPATAPAPQAPTPSATSAPSPTEPGATQQSGAAPSGTGASGTRGSGSNRAARSRTQRYTWHGAWRDRARGTRTPQPRPTTAPTPLASPTATAPATPVPSSGAQPDLAPAPAVVQRAPRAQPSPAAAMPSVATGPLWPWVAGGGLLVLLAAGWAMARLRREEAGDTPAVEMEAPLAIEPEPEVPVSDVVAVPVVPTSPSAPPPPLPKATSVATPPLSPLSLVAASEAEHAPARRRPEPVAAPGARPRLTLDFRPIRAGVNLLSATAEAEVTVTNTGDAPADEVRAEMRLVSAHAGQDEEIAAIYVKPIARPAVPPFALAPGEAMQVRLTAALPRETIRVLTASDRPMFVPLAVVNVATQGGAVQAGQAFAIGIERPGSDKLAPFWLDGPSRMYNSVAARPHGEPLER